MVSKETAKDAELHALLEAAGDDAAELIDAYEPMEAAYRSAVAPSDVYPEVGNTTGLPLALVVNASSAR
jgi:hypothetical protein